MIRNFLQMRVLMYRHFHVSKKLFLNGFINYGILYPLLYGICFGYLFPFIGGMTGRGISPLFVVAGTIPYSIFPLGMQLATDLLIDRERDKTIYYLALTAPSRTVYFSYILYVSITLFVCVLSYFPIVFLVLHSYIPPLSVQALGKFVSILAVGSITCATWVLLMVHLIKDSSQIRFLWRRANYPLLMLGGYLTPHAIMNKFSPFLGKLVYANPALYVTEGVRGAFFPTVNLIPFELCLIMSCLLALVLSFAGLFMFRKRLDLY